jgi:hypothetical protein
MEPKITTITVGKYQFKITDNTLIFRDEIYSRNFKIGGKKDDCVNISITYKDNNPMYASIPYAMYDTECALNVNLDQGSGTILMIKTLLKHIKKELPSINVVHFEDKSNIECATNEEIEKKKSRTMKRGTHIYPIPLYYFSIAFNGETWYEKHFNATQKDPSKHQKYKEKIELLLSSPDYKTNLSFIDFCRLASPPVELLEELESYYNNSNTIGNFFKSIPKKDRCRLVRDWLGRFMHSEFKDVFSNIDWIMPIPNREDSLTGGKKRKTKKYYCPKGKISYYQTYKNFGVNSEDI